MMSVMMKLRKNNCFAMVPLIIILLGQGYGFYLGKMSGRNFNTYVYSKAIASVIPGTQQATMSKDPNIYRKLLEGSIPLLAYQGLGSGEDYNCLSGFKEAKIKNPVPKNEDYFAFGDEIAIPYFDPLSESPQAVTKEQLQNNSYVTSNLINFDANLNFEGQAIGQVDLIKMVEKPFKIDTKNPGPKVLIFHTHHHERFAGEEPGGGGVVDVGAYLKEILENQYGVETLHCTSHFEKTADNATKDDYGRMGIEIRQLVKDHPSIELTIDIHRDGIDGQEKFLTNIAGKQTAKLMFVNGFCQVQKQGKLTPIGSLPNPYIEDNMALALQLQLKALEHFPGFTRKTLVKPYRYSLYFKPKSLLIEVGNQNNTKEEALNTMEVFAKLLMAVIEKD